MKTVRPATEADTGALIKVINAAYRVEAFFIRGDRITEPELRAKLALPTTAFLAIDGGPDDGLAAAVYVEVRGERGYFGLLSVDPGAQGQGLGRVLVEAAEAYGRAAGCVAMEIDVVNLRTELPPFYAKFGYVETGISPFPAPGKLTQPVHLVVMSKSLV
jgi:GNAT superfamily N-acetyltransferase